MTEFLKDFWKKFFDIEFQTQLAKNKDVEKISKKVSWVTVYLLLVECTIFLYGVSFYLCIDSVVLTVISLVIALGVIIYTLYFSKKAKREYFEEKVAKAKKEYDDAMLQWRSSNLDIDTFKSLFPDYTSALNRLFFWNFTRKLFEEKINKIDEGFKSFNNQRNYRHFDNEVENALKIFGYSSIKEVDEGDLKSRYRNLVKSVHPDIKGGDEEKFKKICNAYEILKEKVEDDS